ncbi:Re/Si-specific NAD(P)(+) transhydrogenase subunit alpha [Sandaracinobacteroides saxicola]|uniref:NAD(P) transhydrogenase subunit alpha part 1 n=1 Tax=Sandaracinobacteroides saxicola TaxID=2759707 RepID=A0A7G5IF89_9SPHN|nr:Re/Si-specific NAD(P)(+) transhydrogenase subunit alpha [Sandaracinobacteroides saxicola]QMW22031.1 Re/Si-specific NAD(P)(+) transhydrogenase subunit alpha [Sandaracinobacteroides saxicola]
MKIAVLKETAAGEKRVAATPETVKKFIGLGASVGVEAGAGQGANIPDAAFEAAGASIADRAGTLADAGIVLGVQGPEPAGLPQGASVIAALNPHQTRERVAAYAAAGVTAFAMEFMPRITRAQSMDILSSQSNLNGYKAVIDAAEAYGRAFPMMMTAAGTVSAARVFVMGVGVAGLQAIATAKRLGAVVSATDVRLATKEQIMSLGGKPIFIEDEETKAAETAGGYAKEMSDAYKAKQAALVSETIAKQDIVITTALIPGRPAPRLVTAAQVATMKPGSVIVDLAVEAGGNVEGSVPGEVVVTDGGITIIGHRNYASRLATDASNLYARNLFTFVSTFWDKEGKAPKWDAEDEIIKAVKLTEGGAVVHGGLA